MDKKYILCGDEGIDWSVRLVPPDTDTGLVRFYTVEDDGKAINIKYHEYKDGDRLECGADSLVLESKALDIINGLIDS